MNKKLQEMLAAFSKEWRSLAGKASKMLIAELQKGVKLEAAVKKVRKTYPDLFKLPQVEDLIFSSAVEGYGVSADIVPAEGKVAILTQLSKAWDASGLTLSQKLHGADTQMYKAIINTLETQIRANKSVIDIARALYDGYNADKVIRVQELPDYLQAFRHAVSGDAELLAHARRAAERIRVLGRHGAPNQALATAYRQLLNAAQTGTEKALKNAVYVAVNEKSRYVAERIARTEAAKAWADGFFAEALQDKDVVAFKWELNSRHPVFDICDMYLKSDMYNLGAGIYPKDKVPPLPAHPHCMCRVVKVYRGQINLSKQSDDVDNAVNDWLKTLPENKRKQVLGIQGEKDWKLGKGWEDTLRGWEGMRNPTSRLDAKFVRNLMERNLFPPDDLFLQAIAESRGLSYTLGKQGYDRFFSDDRNPIYPMTEGAIGEMNKEVLRLGVVIDRYGNQYGTFTSLVGTPVEQRSLSPMVSTAKDNYHRYRIIKDLPVLSGRTAAWFGQPGGGWQFKTEKDIRSLLREGYLEEVYDDD